MPPHVRGCARGRLASRARGCSRGCASIGGRRIEASSTSSTSGDVFGGVPRRA